jgi:hypothetical protein
MGPNGVCSVDPANVPAAPAEELPLPGVLVGVLDGVGVELLDPPAGVDPDVGTVDALDDDSLVETAL